MTARKTPSGGVRTSGRWHRAVRSGVAAGQETFRGVTRWQRVEITLTRVIVSGLSLILPIAIGDATGRLPLGMLAAIGALLMSSSGHAGTLRFRLIDMGATLIVGTLAVALGAWSTGLHAVASAVVIVVAATGLAAVGGFHRTAAKISTLATVFLMIGASTGQSAPASLIAAGTAVGAVFAALLTLIGLGAGALLGLQEPVEPPPMSLGESIARWRSRMSTRQGWHYTLRLGSSLVIGELFAVGLHGAHSYWIPLTIALVVQRDHSTALLRTVQRGVGTALGVLLSALFLMPVPVWAALIAIGVIGGLRPYLRGANYAAYAVVMTPLVALFTGLGQAMTAGLLWERLIDTLIGCLIAVVVGWAAWSRLTKETAAAS
ncbi:MULTISPECIES: FUSC family protein [Arthrobacter]|uniref:FUSC family protein n=2 Tax=Arthrobacter TaxID=1663 RepID=A0ABU9KJR7_9MICC|nr:FUSC family protein [Arthrobacter sp. YJM1]MDP5227194.1 FUSC family protein [Arthrobacter sp. YJM1]